MAKLRKRKFFPRRWTTQTLRPINWTGFPSNRFAKWSKGVSGGKTRTKRVLKSYRLTRGEQGSWLTILQLSKTSQSFKQCMWEETKIFHQEQIWGGSLPREYPKWSKKHKTTEIKQFHHELCTVSQKTSQAHPFLDAQGVWTFSGDDKITKMSDLWFLVVKVTYPIFRNIAPSQTLPKLSPIRFWWVQSILLIGS